MKVWELEMVAKKILKTYKDKIIEDNEAILAEYLSIYHDEYEDIFPKEKFGKEDDKVYYLSLLGEDGQIDVFDKQIIRKMYLREKMKKKNI